MSYGYVLAIWKLRADLDPTETRLLMEVADRINGKEPVERGAWPSWQELADASGCCRKKAKATVVGLAAKGFLTLTPRGERESNILRFGPRVLDTLDGVPDTRGWGTEYPGGGVPDTPEPKEENLRKKPSPPTPPSGGSREVWGEVMEAAKSGGNLKCPAVRKWTQVRDRQIRKLRETLGPEWAAFLRAIRSSGVRESLDPLDLSLSRLVSNDCERALAILEGQWFSKKEHAKQAEEAARLQRKAEENEAQRRADEIVRKAGLNGRGEGDQVRDLAQDRFPGRRIQVPR